MFLKTPTVPTPNESRAPYVSGDVIAAKYRLERLLGEGGMGAVWSAHNVALDSPVAIKLIRGETDREALALRLQFEARAAARLGHPAIVRVFDIGQTDHGDPFIVMELLEGESLASKLDRESRLSSIETVQIMLPIADALRAAHSKGIVHRDIKPDNVFVALEGGVVQPKLVDFGIAKLEQAAGGSQLTQQGVVVGSPDYMSPEQARGDDLIDYRTDVWAFSVVLYEAVAGRLPFDATNYNALLRSILEYKPPTLLEMAAADAELSHIVETGMAKDRAERWRSMSDLGVALAAWLKHRGVLEDIVGASLDSKWLNRRSDPAGRTSRPSLGSIADGVFSPASGVAVTVRAPAATDSQTPASSPALARAPLSWARPRTLLFLAVVAAAVIALGYGLFSAPQTPVAPAAPVPVEATAAAEPAIVVPRPPPPAAAPSEASELLPRVPSISPRVENPRRPAPPHKRPAPPGSVRPPGTDLIAPY